ncbi:MAG: chemotaxis protein CheW [Anaerolineae bacterium]|nr:chemotaxis protein CheW [Gloeobacterales cyanobacterium ES-bin-313]
MENFVSMPTISPDLLGEDAPRGDLHLRFELGGKARFAFPASGVVEVVELSTPQITALPNTSPALIGTFNLRGEIIWILDLEFCMQDSLFQNTTQTFPMIVIQEGEHLIGLAVYAIQGMVWLKTEEIAPSQSPLPFVCGQIEEEEILILDPAAILTSQCWAQKTPLLTH